MTMADSALGANSALPRDDGAHQLIGMEAALHERFRLPGAHQFHSLGRRLVAVLRVDQLHACEAAISAFCMGMDPNSLADGRSDACLKLEGRDRALGYAAAGVSRGFWSVLPQ